MWDKLKPGMFAFVANKDPKGSSYDNGEYLVLTVGACNKSFSGCKPSVGYNGHQVKTFHEQNVDINDVYADDGAVENFIKEQTYWSQAPARCEKLSWIESIYSEAAAIARMATRAYEARTGCSIPACPPPLSPPAIKYVVNEEAIVLLRRLTTHLGIK